MTGPHIEGSGGLVAFYGIDESWSRLAVYAGDTGHVGTETLETHQNGQGPRNDTVGSAIDVEADRIAVSHG